MKRNGNNKKKRNKQKVKHENNNTPLNGTVFHILLLLKVPASEQTHYQT